MTNFVGRSRAARWAAIAAVTIGANACGKIDELLDVDAPSRVQSSSLESAATAPLLTRSVQATFECAFGAFVVTTGLVADELQNAQGAAANYPYDQRIFDPGEALQSTYVRSDCFGSGTPGLGVYTPVSSARWFADRTTEKLSGWTDAEVPNRQSLLATAATYAGFSLVLMGEGFCSSAIDGGPEVTKQQLFAAAEARFNAAITAAQAASATATLNAARAGRARARLNQNKKPEALADAQAVPATGFVFEMTAAAAPIQRENRVYDWGTFRPQASVDVPFRGVTWQGVADPRVAVDILRDGAGNPVRFGPLSEIFYTQKKYTAQNTPIAIASSDEAQLIIAEIQLGQAAVDIINRLHTAVGLPGYTPANVNSATEVLTQVIEERRRELFLEGHRLYDIVRFTLPLFPAAGAVFSYGGFYGNQTCFPLPNRERDANPNIN